MSGGPGMSSGPGMSGGPGISPPHVLLSAYQCAPGEGSVSQIGWEWYSRLCLVARVTLATHSRNRKSLEAAGAPLAGSRVLYIDTEWFARPLYRLASSLFRHSQHAVFLLTSLDFYLYDFVLVRRLRHSAYSWDVTHSVTPVSPLAATRLYTLGPPLLVGPWNGGLTSPPAFRRIIREDAGWIYGLRHIGRWVNFLSGCTRHAALILTATKATRDSLPLRARTAPMIENGVDLTLFRPGDGVFPPSSGHPLEVLFVGRLIPVKGISMLLEAVDRVRTRFPIRLTVIGDGPLRDTLQREAESKGLASVVTFSGQQTLSAIAETMRRCHLFCLPSVRESGGAVLLEAMASGLPVLGVDHGGPSELVDDEVGRRLSAAGPDQLIADMAAAFADAVSHPGAWRQRGLNGRRRAEALYGWPARIERALSLYASLIEESQ